MSIPSGLKVKRGQEKYLLKKAFAGILPREIIQRPKDSFTVPLAGLFKNEKQKKEYLDLVQAFNRSTGIFKDEYIQSLALPAKTKEFWNVLNLAYWYEKH